MSNITLKISTPVPKGAKVGIIVAGSVTVGTSQVPEFPASANSGYKACESTLTISDRGRIARGAPLFLSCLMLARQKKRFK